jgi:hypothetical protein
MGSNMIMEFQNMKSLTLGNLGLGEFFTTIQSQLKPRWINMQRICFLIKVEFK